MGELTPYLASLILGAVAIVYYVLVARHYIVRKELELKHKAWLRIAVIFTIVAVALFVWNRYNFA